jgi:hypothetical protein
LVEIPESGKANRGRHAGNSQEQLTDALDAMNSYISRRDAPGLYAGTGLQLLGHSIRNERMAANLGQTLKQAARRRLDQMGFSQPT